MVGLAAAAAVSTLAQPAVVAAAPPTPLDTSLPQLVGQVLDTERIGDELWVGGSFRIVREGVPSEPTTLAVIDLARGVVLPITAPSSVVRRTIGVEDIATDGSTVWVGGYFDRVGPHERPYIAQYDAATRELTPLEVGASYPVHALELVGTTLYAGGYFDSWSCGTQWIGRARLAAIDVTTGCPTGWDPGIAGRTGELGENFYVSDIAASHGRLFVGGLFGGTLAARSPNLAVFDLRSGALTPLPGLPTPDPDVLVGAISPVPDGVWYAGGRPSPARGEEWFTHVDASGAARQLVSPPGTDLMRWQHLGVLAPAVQVGDQLYTGRAVSHDGRNAPRLSSLDPVTGAPRWFEDRQLFEVRSLEGGPGWLAAGGSGFEELESALLVYQVPPPWIDGMRVGAPGSCSGRGTVGWTGAGSRAGEASSVTLQAQGADGGWHDIGSGSPTGGQLAVRLRAGAGPLLVRLRVRDAAGVVGTSRQQALQWGVRKLVGTSRADRRAGCAAPDRIRGLAGNDRLFGGAGRDVVAGGGGRDILVGGPHEDVLLGGPGDDVLRATDGARDLVRCGPGRDVAVVDRADLVDRDCERRVYARP